MPMPMLKFRPQPAHPADLIAYQDSIDMVKKSFKRNYLDSVAGLPIVDAWLLRDIYTYKFCRDHALTLGLDLKGGMSLIMEISQEDVLRKLSNSSHNPQFNQAIVNATKEQAIHPDDYLTIFKKEFEKLNPNSKLAAVFAPIENYQGKITITSSNDEVINVLRKDFDAAIHETFQVLKTRIDQFGVASPNISLQANTGRIILELPGVDDPARVRKLLQQTAQLEFWDTYEAQEVVGYLNEANSSVRDYLAKVKASKDTTAGALLGDTTAAQSSSSSLLLGDSTSAAASTGSKTGDTSKTAAKKDTTGKDAYPLFDVLGPNVDRQSGKTGEGPLIGYAFGKDTAQVDRYLALEPVRSVFPRDLKLLWSAHPIDDKRNLFGLYAIKANPASPEAPLSGDVITDATGSYDQFGVPEVDITMNALGASKWEKMTDVAANASLGGKTSKKMYRHCVG